MGAAKWKGVEGFYFLGSLTIRAKQGLKPYLSTSTSVLGGPWSKDRDPPHPGKGPRDPYAGRGLKRGRPQPEHTSMAVLECFSPAQKGTVVLA